MERGAIWWADLPEPTGSGPGFRHPILIVQSDNFNRTAINTVVIAVLTSNINLDNSLGNVLLSPRSSGLPKDSVVNITQLFTIDKSLLLEYVCTLSTRKMAQVDKGLRLVLSL